MRATTLAKISLAALVLVSGALSAHKAERNKSDSRMDINRVVSVANNESSDRIRTPLASKVAKTTEEVVLRLFAGATSAGVTSASAASIGAAGLYSVSFSQAPAWPQASGNASKQFEWKKVAYVKRSPRSVAVNPPAAEESASMASMLGALVMFAALIGRRLR